MFVNRRIILMILEWFFCLFFLRLSDFFGGKYDDGRMSY